MSAPSFERPNYPDGESIHFSPSEIDEAIKLQLHRQFGLSGHAWKVEVATAADGSRTAVISKREIRDENAG